MIQTNLYYPDLDTIDNNDFILEWQIVTLDFDVNPGIIIIDKNKNYCGFVLNAEKMIAFSNNNNKKSIYYDKDLIWILLDSLSVLEIQAYKDFSGHHLQNAIKLCNLINYTFRHSSGSTSTHSYDRS